MIVCGVCVQGLDALGYKDHIDYDLVESTNPAFQKALVRVNVFRDHRQVSFIPQELRTLSDLRSLFILCLWFGDSASNATLGGSCTSFPNISFMMNKLDSPHMYNDVALKTQPL